MSDEELIVPSGIPQFTGNVDTLVTDAKTMTSDAKLFRDSGASVHSTFQGLQACYKAPEAEKLFATTAPVAAKASAFASDLEKVSGALSTYASEIRPLAKKLGDLKDEAIAFVKSVEGDEHWRRDQKKVDHNNNLWRSVNATVAAFTDAERSCHDKIVALVGGEKLIADDGSHKPNMYGYKASDLDHAEQTPWGSMAEREYTGIAWLGHQIKSFVWDGFIVDGVWGTIKGLGTLVGTDGWDKAGQAWTGLAKLATGLAITASPLGAAYWLTPDDKLPGWLRDSRTAMKETGKALVAYDQWGKNPARAAGGVTFNVLTTVFTGGSGAAAKGGAVAKTVGALGKVAKVVDPMTYVGKAGKFAFVKVGDLMSGLKNLRVGSTVHLAEGTFKVMDDAGAAALPKRPAGLPESAVPFLDPKNKVVYLDKESGKFFNEHGKELAPPKKELSADERAAEAAKSPERQQPHSTASEHEKVPATAGARTGGDATASAARGGEHIPGAGHGPGGSAGHVPGGPGGHVPGGSAGHAPGGTAGHTAGGGAQHVPGGGAGSHVPGGTAHDLGRGPSASHEVPGTGGGNGGHTPTHSGGGSHEAPHPGHDASSSGAGGHNSGGHGGHGDSPSGPHEPAGPRHGDEAPPRDGGGHDNHPAKAHESDGLHSTESGHPNHSSHEGPHPVEGTGPHHSHDGGPSGSGNGPKGVPLEPQPSWHGSSAHEMRHHRFPAEDVSHLTPEEQLAALRERAHELADTARKPEMTKEEAAAYGKKTIPPGEHLLKDGCAGSLLHDGVITSHTSMTKFGVHDMPRTHPVLKGILDRIEADFDAGRIPKKGSGHGKCAEIALISDRLALLERNGTHIRTLDEARQALEGAQIHTRRIGDFVLRRTGEVLHRHKEYFAPCDTCKHVLPELGIHAV
ncbi:YwqJ-related putative deaminase [Streptomyces sp. L500]